MFTRLVRFKDEAGSIHYGELGNPPPIDLIGAEVKTYTDNVKPWDPTFTLTSHLAKIAEVLCPLPSTPILLCVGLNYRRHAVEASFPIPTYPLIFTKPADALAGPYDAIPVSTEALNLDYEGELCVIVGADIKDLSPSEPVEPYILGYTVGNDVSSRYWQDPSRCGSQHGYAKSFDRFAPIGPIICSPECISDPAKLTLTTRVNGELRQETGVDDLIFDVGAILRHLSRGRTVRAGTVIMTGTPSGVAAFMKPPKWLQDGDVVEIEVGGIGMIRNKIVMEQ